MSDLVENTLEDVGYSKNLLFYYTVADSLLQAMRF
jgi:hypothetical protein